MTLKPGQRVNLVLRDGGNYSASQLPAGHSLLDPALKEALGKGQEVHRTVIVDRIIDAETVRVVIEDTMELVWVHPNDLAERDPISLLGDKVGARSRTWKDGLQRLENGEPDSE